MGTMLALFHSCGTLPSSIELVITSQIGCINCSLHSFSVQPDTPSGPIANLTSRFPNNLNVCVCVCACVSPMTISWSNGFNAMVQKLQNTLTPTMPPIFRLVVPPVPAIFSFYFLFFFLDQNMLKFPKNIAKRTYRHSFQVNSTEMLEEEF